MVGSVGRLGGAMVRDNFSSHPWMAASERDSGDRPGFWTLDALSEGALRTVAYCRSFRALHRGLQAPFRG
jgi:hypothetical protein